MYDAHNKEWNGHNEAIDYIGSSLSLLVPRKNLSQVNKWGRRLTEPSEVANRAPKASRDQWKYLSGDTETMVGIQLKARIVNPIDVKLVGENVGTYCEIQ